MIKKVFNKFKNMFTGKSMMDKQFEFMMSVEGQISKLETAKLIDLAAKVPLGLSIVEIGSFRGKSAISLAYGSLLGNKNRVYAIDPHEEFIGVMGGVFGPKDQKELYANIVMAGVGEIVAVVSLPSAIASRAWAERNIGILWYSMDRWRSQL